MQTIFDEICNELADIGNEAKHLSAALARTDGISAMEYQDIWEQTHVRASAIEKIYTGCERVMSKLASSVDGVHVEHSAGWHSTLLKRLVEPAPTREALLSIACYGRLDRLRAFRHRERNSYGINLDVEIVSERAKEAVDTFRIFRTETLRFLERQGYKPSG